MSNPANPALFGVTSFADGGEVLIGGATTSYLSGIDIFFTDRNAISASPTPADISNLVSFVNGGGVLLIHNDRSTTFTSLDPLLNAFGIDLVSLPTDSLETLTIPLPLHPIMDGPFGQVSAMQLRDASRYAATSGEVVTVAAWQNGDGAITVLPPGAGRLGAVIVLPDVERFLLDFDSSLGTGQTETAALNAVAYAVSLAVPEPGSAMLLIVASVLSLMRRRRA
jgi:hypothetical protein